MKPATIDALARRLDAGQDTAVGLTDSALARADAPDGEGARVFVARYPDSARAAARASDILRGAGLGRSIIEGLPISVKDLFDLSGEPTRSGSVVLDDAAPATRDAVVVQRLRAAGAVIVGRTNMTEFAYSGLGINPHYGTPRNPWDRATGRIPGGSSSGAAVSVSDGMAAAAIGSDTGGSVRIPAALCGLTGFKPTAERVSMEGVLPLSLHLDSIGPIAPSVRCCAELDAILSGDNRPLPTPSRLKGLRLGVVTTIVQNDMEPAVAQAFQAALDRLSKAGALVEDLALPAFDRLSAINAKGGFTAAEAFAWHRPMIERAANRYDPRVVSRIKRGEALTAGDFIELVAARRAWIDEVETDIAPYDAILMPTVPLIAPAIDTLQQSDDAYYRANGLMLRNPTFINFLDGCALSVPCHTPGEAPVGLMISAARGADRRVLSIGMAIEALLQQAHG